MDATYTPLARERNEDLLEVLPLYASSLVVTLAGIGAVGVTQNSPGWTPVWVLLAILGHGVSLAFRRVNVAPETLFYPVMLLGSAIALQQTMMGTPASGLDTELGRLAPDMATAIVVGVLAVVRTFTLVTNGSLLFSPIPSITMLALSGSSNPNAEIPLFFGLLLLGALFSLGYEAHLRRCARTNRPAGPLLFHVLSAWMVVLGVSLAAVLFPLLIQPAASAFSPFALSSVRNLVTLQFPQNQAPVGRGPITLSPTPVYEVYSPEGGLLRTNVYASYTGRGWTTENPAEVTDLRTETRVSVATGDPASGIISNTYYRFDLRPDPDLVQPTPVREVVQRFVTRGYSSQAIPALGRIARLDYPRWTIVYHSSGSVTGNGHTGSSKSFELVSRIPEYDPARLRAAPAVDAARFDQPEMLSVPQSAYEVDALAHQVTQGIPNAYDRIQALIGYIEKHCAYTLQEAPTPPGQDAAAYYLFTTKRGACDLAATALAVMCRSIGIPARVAVGYVAEEPLPGGGGFMVRQEHGHMWVEAFFPGYGWVPFNPAPTASSIKDNLLQVAWYRLLGLFSKIGGGGLDALLLIMVVLATAALALYAGWVRVRQWLDARRRERRTYHSSPAGAVAVEYARLLRMLDRRGWRRELWMTPQEYLAARERDWRDHPEALCTLTELTQLYQRALYAEECPAEAPRLAAAACRALTRTAPPALQQGQRPLPGEAALDAA